MTVHILSIQYCIAYKVKKMYLRNSQVSHINKLTLIEVTSCMTINGIKQATDNVAPRGHNVIGWHIVE